jgi:hypothetical protein
MIWKFVLRDTALVAAAVAAWWGMADASRGTGPVADLVGVVCGGLAGAVAFVLHEWGHYLAGLAAGGRLPVATSLKSPFLFDIDAGNGVRPFTILSLGGFAVTVGGIVFVYSLLPDELLATRVVRGIVLFLASLTLLLEVPLLLYTIWSGRIPEAASVAAAPSELSDAAGLCAAPTGEGTGRTQAGGDPIRGDG